MAAAVDYLRSLGDGSLDVAFELIEAHELELSRRFLDGIGDAVELYGIGGADGRTPTFCFNVPGESPRSVAQRLGEQDIYCGTATTTRWSRCARSGLSARGGRAGRFPALHVSGGGRPPARGADGPRLGAADGLAGSPAPCSAP